MKRNDAITVGIWGCGYVGGNTARLFQELGGTKINVLCYDKFKPGKWSNPFELIDRSDFIFVCLPTPMDHDGSIDLKYIYSTMYEINEYISKNVVNNGKIIIARSTMVPGSSDILSFKFPHLNIVFVPEFLTEKNAWLDTVNASRVIIGAEDLATFTKVAELFRVVYPDQGKTKIVAMDRSEAEMYKYACNYLLAMNALCANELYFMCDNLNIDYDVIQRSFALDPRIGTHTMVPGPDGDFGIGGKCFPKDINALRHLAVQNGYDPVLLNAGIDFNEKIRNNKDWLEIPGAVSACGFQKGE